MAVSKEPSEQSSKEMVTGKERGFSLDPFEIRIQEEVEEFLRDLTLEYPFPSIFETLRRFEFKDRFGRNVVPFPKGEAKNSPERLRDIDVRIRVFLAQLRAQFGANYHAAINDSFRFYTQTTVD